MRAMIVRNPASVDGLALTEWPDIDLPGPGQIAVRLRAASLNYHDYLVVSGAIPVEHGRVPLSDGAGEIVAVGEGVTDFAVGDHAASLFHTRWLDGRMHEIGFQHTPGEGLDGYARDTVVVPAAWFTHVPDGYSHAEAATLPCAAVTAWRALAADGPVLAGETVLIQGSGGVAVFALQFAKAMGARVIATSSSDEKLQRLKALGADYLINYKTTPEWGTAAFALTGGVDHVIEIGGPATLPQSIAAIGIGGHIALIGVLTGWAGKIPTAEFMTKAGRLQGVIVGSRRDQVDMISAIEACNIRPIIDRNFDLTELGAGFYHQKSGAHLGKIVVDIN